MEALDPEEEVIALAGELYVRRVYDVVLQFAEAAKPERSWLYRHVPKEHDEVVDLILPEIVASTVLAVIEEFKRAEICDEKPSLKTVVTLADGSQVTPADRVDLYYEAFGPDGLFAKYSDSRLPSLAEGPE